LGRLSSAYCALDLSSPPRVTARLSPTRLRSGTRQRRWWRAPVFAASAPCLQTLPATRRGSWRSGRPRLRWPFTRNGGTRLTATVRLPAALPCWRCCKATACRWLSCSVRWTSSRNAVQLTSPPTSYAAWPGSAVPHGSSWRPFWRSKVWRAAAPGCVPCGSGRDRLTAAADRSGAAGRLRGRSGFRAGRRR
jgi:hypothetical protein